jgi:hypothetical protein
MLMITGDNDGSPMRGKEDLGGDWRRKAFDCVRPGDMYLLWVENAYHGFGGINGNQGWPGAGPNAPDQVLAIRTTCLAFFDAYLHDNKEAQAYLTSGTLAAETREAAAIEHKATRRPER